MKQEVKIGQADYTVLVLIRDSTTGAPKTALTYASAGIDVCYSRVETDNDVVLTDGAPVETTLTGTHVDWGFVKVDDTKAPGLYKLDIADGVFATGAWSSVVSFICTGCDPVHLEFVLVPEAPYAGVSFANIFGTALTAQMAAAWVKFFNVATPTASVEDLKSSLDTIASYIDTEVASILAAVDTEVGLIKTKTDKLTYTSGNDLDVNIQKINDVEIEGDGTFGNEWGKP
jgi:hypothetical protein